MGSGEQFPSVSMVSINPGSCVLTTEVSNVNAEDMHRLNASLHSSTSGLIRLGAIASTLQVLEKLPQDKPLAAAIVVGAVTVIVLCVLLVVCSVVKCANRTKERAHLGGPVPPMEKMRLTSNKSIGFDADGFSIESGALQRGNFRINGFHQEHNQLSATMDITTLDDVIGGPQESRPNMALAYPHNFESTGEAAIVDLTRSRLDFANSVWSDTTMQPPQQQRQHAVVKFQF